MRLRSILCLSTLWALSLTGCGDDAPSITPPDDVVDARGPEDVADAPPPRDAADAATPTHPRRTPPGRRRA